MTFRPSLIEVGGQGQTLHFAHANGYPPLSYGSFLQQLTPRYRVVAAPMRPLWTQAPPPETLRSWHVMADDLIGMLELNADGLQRPPVIGAGHSMGAVVTLLAALKRPELFSRLVLIEPAFISRRRRVLLRLFSQLAPEKVPLIRSTLRRRDCWASRQEMFDWFRDKKVFAGIADPQLREYVEHGSLVDDTGLCRLSYSKEWEARCYSTIADYASLVRKTTVPVLAVRAARSDTLSEQVWQRWQQLAPDHDFVEVADAGHLLPLEQPGPVARIVLDWLAG